MKFQPNSGNMLPLPTDEFFTGKITGAKDQPNPFDNGETTNLNVEFTITEPAEYAGRKTWRTFGSAWPTEDKTGTTLLFDLVAAFDPSHAVKGQEYDSDQLLGKYGRFLMMDKKKKDGTPNLDDEGRQRQQPKDFKALKGGSPVAPAAATSTAPGVPVAAGTIPKF